MEYLKKISDFAGKKMAYIVLIVAGISFYNPMSFRWALPDLTFLLGIIMFGMGMTLSKKDFESVVKNPKIVAIGVVIQYVVMPLTALLVVTVLRLPKELALGVILVGTCPGGTSSNVMTYLAKGDVPLSLSVTIVSTILSPVLTPAITLLLAGKWVPIELTAMFFSIAKVVVVPIVLGIIAKKFFSNITEKLSEILPLVSVISIVLIVGAVVGVNASKIATSGFIIIIAVIIHNILGYTLGYTAGKALKLNLSKRKAIAMEVGMQNSGLAASLAMTNFTPTSAIAGAIFSVWHNISGAVLANYWSKKTEE